MENALKQLLQICAIFGIFISSGYSNSVGEVNTSMKSNSNSKTCPIKSWYHLNLIFLQRFYICCIILTICFLWIYGIGNRDYEVGFLLTWFVATISFSSQILAHFMVLLEALFKKEQHHNFLCKLNEIELTLSVRLKQHIPRSALLRQLKWIFFSTWLLSFMGLVIFIVVVTLQHDIGYLWYGFISILTLRLRILELSMYAIILKNYCVCLNIKLRQLIALKTAENAQLLDINYEKLKTIEFLALIKETYAQLFDAFELLNDMAGWSLFAIVSCYFLDFNCHVYWSLLALDKLLEPHAYVAGAATLVPILIIISNLCWIGEQCKQQGSITANLLNKLIGTIETTQKTRRYKNFVHQFSLQLRHQCIEISAKHFFSFDLQLIMAICAAIATYLIILIQFLKSDENI